MIVAGLVLAAIGAADLVRLYLRPRHRWIGYAGSAALLLAVAYLAGGWVWWFFGVAAAAAWALAMPGGRRGAAGLWPVALLAALCAAAVAIVPRSGADAPLTDFIPGSALVAVTPDAAVMIIGAVVFLLESGNVVVRAALRDGGVEADRGEDAQAFKGGRLIGPLERVMVFALTLSGAFTLIAAVLAAKGIVRFPEISRDSGTGARAEYFLVGSLVSWSVALGAALLVWWGTTA